MLRKLLQLGLAGMLIWAPGPAAAPARAGEAVAAPLPYQTAPAEPPVRDDILASLQCRDRFGHDVPLIKVQNLGDIGRAWYMNRVPIIAIDPHIAGRLPDKLVRFFYDHECAHHVLGHWFFFAPDRENDADCWAVTRERDAGLLRRDEIVGFAPFLASSPGSPWGHLPGPERVRHLLFCYDKPLGG